MPAKKDFFNIEVVINNITFYKSYTNEVTSIFAYF